MPLYEYGCKKCGEVNEVLQKISDPAPKACEFCGSKRLDKLMSQGSFILKGEGWYVTDYARKGKDAGASKDTGSSGTSTDASPKPKKTEKKSKKSGDGGKAA